MRKKIKDIRREELLQATLDTIHAEGLHNITVAKLSKTAGMSQGMVHHYFKNKAEIIEAAIRHVNAELRTELVKEMGRTETPTEKLFKILDINFAPHWFNPQTTRLWVSFCSEVPFNDTFARIQAVIHNRMHSNLKHILKALLTEHDPDQISHEISNLIDGFWIRASVGKHPVTPAEAITCLENYLKRLGIERP